ncbi:hypothetical protein TRFO_01931 [Tritrichomonas foetus]|uniref:Uncharacterized protein n=1 Tax=Tritrichomonas foetus TaxID=1144522 RepID=A0A1J4JI37_9EUKA|nr:hypothetical protein TRFO_01931 [Tritrichomonas foetus]|eukprot:OHS98848.1 hypothetical protein TRFO_01931 [Tritrichomonas foetus]
MNDFHDSEMDTDNLMRRLHEARSIAEYGKDQTKLLNDFQSKVKELLFYREESINLKTQLQISKDSQQMMEAEFAFQKSELESEIEKRKQTEQELRNALMKKETDAISQSKHIDVNALVTVEEKYKKWKQIAEDTTNRIEKLQDEYQSIQNSLKKSNEKIEEQKDVIHQLKDELEKRPTENQINDLQKHIQRLQNRIERRNQAIVELQKQNESLRQNNSQSGSFVLQGADLSQENERLRLKLERALKSLDKLKSLEKKVEILEESNAHYDAERQVLNDILQTEDIDPNQEWYQLREKAKQGMDAIAKLEDTTSLLATAEKKIAETSSSSEIINNLQKQLNENEEKMAAVTSLQQKLAKTENEFEAFKLDMENIRIFAEQQKIRCDFSKIVAENQQRLVMGISDLHYNITGCKDILLRPILLATVFCTRWMKLLKQPKKPFDSTSLIAFTSIPSHSIEAKLHNIQEIFVSLSKELLSTKSSLQKALLKADSYKKHIKEMGGDFESNNIELQNAHKRFRVYKSALKELNNQVSLLVSPQEFEKALTKATDFEIQIDQLNKHIHKLNNLIEEKDEIIRNNNRDLQKADLQHQEDVITVESVMKDIDNKKEEITILKAKLQDRTKDLLSLERIVNIKQPDLIHSKLITDEESVFEEKIPTPINPMFLVSNPEPDQ